MIELSQVTYTYPSRNAPTLNELSLRVPFGTFLLVVGASGAGKSTLLRLLNGLVPHFYGGILRGRVRVGGRDPVALGPRGMSDLVGFVFQNPEAQFVTRLVEDELAFAMENRNLPLPLMRQRVEEVLDQLGIADLRGRQVETLSGGQRQLVAIASVLTLQPAVLVLDEPTSQLDPHAAEQVLNVLQRLNLDLGLTIVLSEHRLERVAQYADQICYLPQGGAAPVLGEPRTVLAHAELAPPLVQLGRALGWQPPPLTIKESRPFAQQFLAAQPIAAVPAVPPPPSAKPPAPAAVLVEGLAFRYSENTVLRKVDLAAYPGDLVALMGRNGSGKTTLLKNLVGLLKPLRGKVRVNQLDPTGVRMEQITRQVGLVPQNPGRLLFNETVAEELRFTCRAHGLPETGIEALLARLDLAQLQAAYPRDLSVGEQQRVALASILIAQPRVLLLDEPTRGLDYVSKEKLIAILQALRAEGVTIVMASHDVELVAQCANRVVLLGGGEVIAAGNVRSVMNGSLVFAPQVNKALRDERFLTVADVLAYQKAASNGARG